MSTAEVFLIPIPQVVVLPIPQLIVISVPPIVSTQDPVSMFQEQLDQLIADVFAPDVNIDHHDIDERNNHFSPFNTENIKNQQIHHDKPVLPIDVEDESNIMKLPITRVSIKNYDNNGVVEPEKSINDGKISDIHWL